jgi:hypothetical protein
MYSQLLGREIGFSLRPAGTVSKAKPIFGVYKTVPVDDTIVVRADLPLFGTLAGVFVGLPAPSVAERLKTGQLDEVLSDGIHELFNITSTPLSTESRVVFKTMHLESACLSESATKVLAKPIVTTSFDVTIGGTPGGLFQVLNGL